MIEFFTSPNSRPLRISPSGKVKRLLIEGAIREHPLRISPSGKIKRLLIEGAICEHPILGCAKKLPAENHAGGKQEKE